MGPYQAGLQPAKLTATREPFNPEFLSDFSLVG